MPIRDPKRELSLKQMGFREDPFTNSADPRFLYLSAQHGDVLERTQNVIENFRGLAVVEGGFGVGKSTLARRLESIYRTAPDNNIVVYIHNAAYTSGYAALLDVSTVYLNIPRKKGAHLQWHELESFLNYQARHDQSVIIIMDDAQKMAPDALDFIHTIYNYDINRKLAQVILFGQPEINRIFNLRPEVRSRVYSWLTLHPLSFKEAFELINFRCNVAGRNKPMLSADAFFKVNEIAKGTPREIVTLCSEIIDELTRQGKNPGNDGMVAEDIVDNAIRYYLEAHPQAQFASE